MGFAASARAEFQPALLAEGEVRGELFGFPAEAGELKQPLHVRPRAPGAREPAVQETGRRAVRHPVLRHPEVLPDAEMAEQADVLEGAGDSRGEADMRRRAGDVAILETDFARGHREHATDQVDGRALAGPVGADQAENLAFPDLQVEPVDRAHPAEMLGQGLKSEHGPDR